MATVIRNRRGEIMLGEIMIKKLLNEIDNIEQLAADMRYKVDNDNLDLDIELESINNWVKSIKRILKRLQK